MNKTRSFCSRILYLIKGNKTDTDKFIKLESKAMRDNCPVKEANEVYAIGKGDRVLLNLFLFE